MDKYKWKRVKAYIEAELRDYHTTLRDLEELKDNIILSAPQTDGERTGVTYKIGRPTEARTISILTNKRIKRMEQTIKAIRLVLAELTEDKVRLVELKYWQRPRRLTDAGIALELNVEERTMYRWANDICWSIAVEMGFVNECQKCVSFNT